MCLSVPPSLPCHYYLTVHKSTSIYTIFLVSTAWTHCWGHNLSFSFNNLLFTFTLHRYFSFITRLHVCYVTFALLFDNIFTERCVSLYICESFWTFRISRYYKITWVSLFLTYVYEMPFITGPLKVERILSWPLTITPRVWIFLKILAAIVILLTKL